MSTHWETLKVDGDDMKAFVGEPDTTGRHPGIVVVMGKTGIDEALQGQVADLAAHGFVSIASDMFHREDPNAPDYDTANMRVLDVNIEKDVNVAISTLKAHALVDPKRIGIVGFCMGGRISYLMATRNSEIKAAAVYYGGNIMKPRGDGPSPFEQTAKISCPGYRTFRSRGRKPFTVGVQKIDAELKRLGKVHEFHSYSDAGHAFMGKGRSSYREHAAKDAWPKTLDWFQKHLAAALKT